MSKSNECIICGTDISKGSLCATCGGEGSALRTLQRWQAGVLVACTLFLLLLCVFGYTSRVHILRDRAAAEKATAAANVRSDQPAKADGIAGAGAPQTDNPPVTPPVAPKPKWASVFLSCLNLMGQSKDKVVSEIGAPDGNFGMMNRYDYEAKYKDDNFALYLFFGTKDNNLASIQMPTNFKPSAGEVWEALGGPDSKPLFYQAHSKSMENYWQGRDANSTPQDANMLLAVNGVIQNQRVQLNGRISQPPLKAERTFDTKTDSYVVGKFTPNPDCTWRDAKIYQIETGESETGFFGEIYGQKHLLDGTVMDTNSVRPAPKQAAKTESSSSGKRVQATPKSLPQSPGAIRQLTEYDLVGKSKWDLDLMRNDYFARRGLQFAVARFREYYLKQPWYHPGNSNQQTIWNRMSAVERYNAVIIQNYEKKHGML